MIISFLKRRIPDRFTLFTYALFIHQHYWVIAAATVVLIGGMLAFPASYFTNMNVLLGIFLLPFSIWIVGKQRINYWLLSLLVFLIVLVCYSPVNIFFFFAIALFLLLVVEIHIGRVNAIVLFLVFFMSPFFEQVAGILGFPVRLFLTDLAGQMLLFSGVDVQVEGNMMVLHGNGFTVDDACMGLNMLSTALLVGVLVIVHQYKTRRCALSFGVLSCFFVVIFGFNMLCNLFRIITLVLFNIGPGDFMHEGIGLICFVVYSVVPTYYLAGWLTRRFAKNLASTERSYRRTHPLIKSAVMLIAIAILWIGMDLPERKMISERFDSEWKIPAGFSSETLDQGVVKMSNDEALIYLKPIPEFFSGEHTPLFCWKGSGYEIKRIQKHQIGSCVIYIGELVRSEGKLWTGWWYSNGDVQTIDQFNWRGRMLRGEKNFSLINITAADEETMLKYAQQLLAQSFDPISKTR